MIFKLLFQLSQSADISPSLIDFNSANNRTYPNDLWATSSFELSHNHWHHVTVRWGSKFYGNLGSIVVDGNETEFKINSASLFTKVGDPHVVVGNFYQGTSSALASFFNNKVKPKRSPLQGAIGTGTKISFLRNFLKRNSNFKLIIPNDIGNFIGYSYQIEWDFYE